MTEEQPTPWYGARRVSGDSSLRQAEHLALLRPFGRQVGETGNAHAVRKPTIDGGFDEIRGEEGE
jgi:hypothetical protein